MKTRFGNNIMRYLVGVGKPITITNFAQIRVSKRQHIGAFHAIAALS